MQQRTRDVTSVYSESIRQRIERLAMRERRGVSQMARILLEDQLDLVEKAMQLPPVDEDQEYIAELRKAS